MEVWTRHFQINTPPVTLTHPVKVIQLCPFKIYAGTCWGMPFSQMIDRGTHGDQHVVSIFCFCWQGQIFQPFSLILLKNPLKGIREQSCDIVIWKGVPLALSIFFLFFLFLFSPEGSDLSDYSVSFLYKQMQHFLVETSLSEICCQKVVKQSVVFTSSLLLKIYCNHTNVICCFTL